MRTVLFVCTGNTCRSPMAEAIARHHLDQGLLGPKPDIFVASAGIQAGNGSPPTTETLNTLSELGIDYDGRSKPLTAQMIRKADLVFTMTSSHLAAAKALVGDSPENMDKIVQLDPNTDIEDPIGMGQDAYDSLGKRLSVLIPKRLKEALVKSPKRSLS